MYDNTGTGRYPTATQPQGADDAGRRVLMHRLRQTTMRNPRQATIRLQRLTDPGNAAVTDVNVRVDLMTLLAEAYQRDRQVTRALDVCSDAAVAACDRPRLDWEQILAIAAVSAGLAVWAARPEAVDACGNYVSTNRCIDRPDRRRVLFARALRAVAVYHAVGCAEGRRLLTVARQDHAGGDHQTAIMLADALTAMYDGCLLPRHQRPAGPPPPIPGGMLHPYLDAPARDQLSYLVKAHNATHTCSPELVRPRETP